MKYTKEYVATHRVAVECNGLEEKLKFLNMIGEALPVLTFGGIKCKDITLQNLLEMESSYEISRVGRYDLGKDTSVCHEKLTNGWYKDKNFEIITFQQFIDCNIPTYELY